ncbi:MAG: phosphopantetheine-binding protein [Acidobacteriota bacterium]
MSDHSLPSRAEILATVADIARQELDHEGPVEPSHRLVEDLELDSIRLLTLATAVEDHFRILLDEADETSIETVDDLLDVIEAKLTSEPTGEIA